MLKAAAALAVRLCAAGLFFCPDSGEYMRSRMKKAKTYPSLPFPLHFLACCS